MKGATYILGKHRVYVCPQCGGRCHRPLQAADTICRPFPKPCDVCDTELSDVRFVVVDSLLDTREELQ